jgi:hypothetical protein
MEYKYIKFIVPDFHLLCHFQDNCAPLNIITPVVEKSSSAKLHALIQITASKKGARHKSTDLCLAPVQQLIS